MTQLLHIINLGDRYEIGARVMPALLVVVPVTSLVAVMEWSGGHWGRAVGLGAGLEGLLAVLFSRLGHAYGQRLEKQLKERWGGFPTTRWLMPADQTHSSQQKARWRQTLEYLSGLQIEEVIAKGDMDETRRVIDDAVLAVRNRIRNDKRAELLRQHNIYYGFSRNLAGLRWYATGLTLLCLVSAQIGVTKNSCPQSFVFIDLLFFLLSIGFAFRADNYVHHCAERYAEFFLTTASQIAGTTSRKRSGVVDSGKSA